MAVDTGAVDAANLRRPSLKDQVLELIRQALVAGDLRPGEIYSASATATRLGTSNGPVREAMLTLVDELGRVFLRTDLGLGLVHTQDMTLLADAVEAGRWSPREVHSAELPALGGYVLSPQAARARASQF